MRVRPESKIEDTRLSNIEELKSSSSPKNKIKKLITANETE
jgi:hypothetical protein